MYRLLLPVAASLLPFGAQSESVSPIGVELNAAETDGQNCILTFVVQNDLPASLTELVTETVLFDTEGQVDRLTLFDFGAVPAGRQRVRQFAVTGLTCENLGRILFNGTERCIGDDLAPEACDGALRATTRTPVEVLQ